MKTQYNQVYQILFATLLCILTFFASQVATAQHPHYDGYWVVESNVFTKDFTTVKFYDDTDKLLYEEKLTGICLDIARKKNIKLLNHTLKMLQHNRLIAGQMKGYSEVVATTIAKKTR